MTRRFFVAPEAVQKTKAVLRGSEAHHALRVMRMKKGDRITLFDGRGHEYAGVIQNLAQKEVTVSIEQEEGVRGERPILHVACAVPRLFRMEGIVEKMTELGVGSILPFISERTVPRITKEAGAKKLARWRRIAAEAAKQSERATLPEIPNILTFEEILSLGPKKELALFLAPEAPPIRQTLERQPVLEAILAVGPEGGWSSQEEKKAEASGWTVCSLGKQILKVDTACIAAVSILHYESSRACSSVG